MKTIRLSRSSIWIARLWLIADMSLQAVVAFVLLWVGSTLPEPTLKVILPPVQDTREGEGFAYSPDGKILAVGDRSIHFWSTTDWSDLGPLDNEYRTLGLVSFSSDGTTLANSYILDDERITIWDSVSRMKLGELNSGGPGSIRHLAWSPDGRMLGCSTSSEKTPVIVWDVASTSTLWTLGRPPSNAIAFTADGNSLASGGDDGWIRMWEAKTGREVSSTRAHDGIRTLAMSPDGATLATCGCCDHSVKIWKMPGVQLLATLSSNIGEIRSVDYSADSKLLAVGGGDPSIFSPDRNKGWVEIWDVDFHVKRMAFPAQDSWDVRVAFSPTNKNELATGQYLGSVKVWDVSKAR